MAIQKLEDLTTDSELLLRAKLALKVVHEWATDIKFKYNPVASEIVDRVAMQVSGNADLVTGDDFDLDALNRERKKCNELGVIAFLTSYGFIQPLVGPYYWMPPEVVKQCPRLYQ